MKFRRVHVVAEKQECYQIQSDEARSHPARNLAQEAQEGWHLEELANNHGAGGLLEYDFRETSGAIIALSFVIAHVDRRKKI